MELLPKSYVERLIPSVVFGRQARLKVDLGCGDGTLLCALAQREPEADFLGIERLAGRVRVACHKAAELPNVRILQLETNYAINYLLPPHSVTDFYLLFPDPWPKRRHHRRRVVSENFFKAVSRALAAHGKLHIATDQIDYFEYIHRCAMKMAEFTDTNDQTQLPLSTFGTRFERDCVPVYRAAFRKVSPVT